MNDFSEKLIEEAFTHKENKNIEIITATFRGLMENAERSAELFYNPQVMTELPASIPLKGGGVLKLGLQNGGTYNPILYIDLLSNTPRGEDEHYQGKIELSNNHFIFSSMNPNQKDSIFLDALARIKPTKDIDLEAMSNRTNDQEFILTQFKINNPSSQN